MPLYEWEDVNTGKRVEVQRKISESDKFPTVEESGLSEAKWIRVYSKVGKSYAKGWGSDRKGKYNSRK